MGFRLLAQKQTLHYLFLLGSLRVIVKQAELFGKEGVSAEWVE